MPWKVSHVMNERMKLVMRLEQGEGMSALCREFGISRKTAYKFADRFKRFGALGLADESRKPIRFANAISEEVQMAILEIKSRYPSWGARKIQDNLKKKYSSLAPPAVATVHRILDRNGKVKHNHRPRRPRTTWMGDFRPFKSANANDVWSMDFKGQFSTKDKKLCYPLTVADHCTRYLIGCEALENVKVEPTRQCLEVMFRENGLPDAFLSDNGVPFGSPQSLFGLSRLSIWLLRLGIGILRIDPGHPEQNGRHERMHLTLKREATRPVGKNLLQQQERFDEFQKVYNFERPHEALDMQTPGELWKPSKRAFPRTLDEPAYPNHHETITVYETGKIYLKGQNQEVLIGAAFAGEKLGLRQEDDDLWRITFMQYDLGFLDRENRKFTPMESLTRN